MDDNTQKIEELTKALEETENNWKRAVADYRNLERRYQDERMEFIQYANETLIKRLVPLLDNMEALEKFSEDQGVKLVTKEFRQVLKDTGLEIVEINTGDTFDSNTMDAVEMEEITNEKEEVAVKDVYKKAYKFNNKLIRPATVKAGYKEKEK